MSASIKHPRRISSLYALRELHGARKSLRVLEISDVRLHFSDDGRNDGGKNLFRLLSNQVLVASRDIQSFD
ncbi:hypothetical protein KR99_25380 [Ralstonia solanacearum]|nr:hypothetical protein KR99_25380 [Ralstonia solanacearum]